VKILYISPRYEGGIGGHAKRVAEKLQEHGFDVDLMNVPYLPIKNLKNPSFTILGTIKAIMNHKEYDIAHAWNIPSAFVMKKIKAKKKVLSIHGVYGEQIKKIHSKPTSHIGKKAEKEALKIADVITTDSKYVQKYYENKLAVKVTYLPAPLDISKFSKIRNINQKKNQVIYIGRDSIEKGIDVLKSIENKINANVIYCTDAPWEETMEKLKESSLLIVPSRMESIPQTIKEAFYLKIPVIATSVGGIPEIIEHKKNGILVSPNSSNDLLKSINYLLENPKIANELSISGYDFIIKNFTWENLLPKYINFYKNLS
jgi:glycosyltransferase involved in cell wall biosynthesis